MSSPSPGSSAAASQIVCSEVANQTLMSVIAEFRAQLTSLSRRQDELIDFVTDLRRELKTRTELVVPAPSTIGQSFLEPASIVLERTGSVATNSSPLSGQGAEPAVEPQISTPDLPTPLLERRIRREHAFCHTPNTEEAPWKALGGYHPYRHGTHPTQDRPIPEWPASPFSLSLNLPPLRHGVSDSRDEGNRLPAPCPLPPLLLLVQQGYLRLPHAQGAPALPPPAATTTLPAFNIRPVQTLRTYPSHREGEIGESLWFPQPPFVVPNPGIFQPLPCPPKMVLTASAAFLSPQKRKREDVGGVIDDEEASDKKHPRRPSTYDVD